MLRFCALVLGAGLFATPAFATCKEEVDAAFAKQRGTTSFRMVTKLPSEQGPLEMTVDYKLPDRMHQTVETKLTKSKVETILVGEQAWTNEGKGWVTVPSEFVGEIAKQMKETVVEPPKNELEYACLGTVTVDGRELRAYRVEEATPKPAAGAKPPDPPTRMLYVDAATGLPARTTAAQVAKPDKPFLETDYSYPTDITVAPPKVEAKAPAGGNASP